MKKNIALFLILAILVIGVGAKEVRAQDDVRIGLSVIGLKDLWLTYMVDVIETEADNMEGVSLTVTDAREDSAKQISQIENFVIRGVDAIMMVPVSPETSEPAIEIAEEAGIPIIFVNMPPSPEYYDRADSYVGGNSKQSGLLQAEYIAEELNYEGNIAIMNGTLGHEAQIKRTEGFMEVINEHPGMEVVLEGTGNFNRPEGMELMENWLQTGEEIDAVMSNNDEMAIGAIKALEAEGKLDEVVVGGIDATPAALEYLREGKLTVTVFQDANGQGKTGLEQAVKAARGEDIEQEVLVPYQLVTLENVDEFVAKWEQASE